MPASIPATKLYAPPPRPDAVPRPRLIERLNEGLLRRPGVTLISAPAGFGKTTLISEWIHSPHPAKVAWLSLDEGDSDPARFLACLIAAMQTIAPKIGQTAWGALQSPQPPAAEVLLTSLLNDIAARGDIVLVLDDYHAVESRPVDAALAFLVDHLPPRLRLVIVTREDPALPLPRLRGGGRLTELRAADLRFTPDEAAAFLNEAMGLRLSAADVAALELRTEGWIAGLQLAALSLQGRQDPGGFIEAFTGSHRFVLDYLMEEVLRHQPEGLRLFLQQTSILHRLCGPLCDAVTQRADGRGLLEALERGNLFIVSLDDQRQWYRYHHLFADMLQARLLAEQPDRVPELHRRASAWYGENQQPIEAVRHALLAGDRERAAEWLERVWLAMDLSYQSAVWLSWARQLPDDLIRVRPVLCLGYAWALLNAGELEASESRLRDAERWLEPSEDAAAARVVVDEAEFRSLPASIAGARAYRALALGDVPGTIAFARRALALAAKDDRLRRLQATGLLGVAEYASGDLPAAERSLLDVQAAMWRTGDSASALAMTFVLASIWLAQGRLRHAVRAYRQALQLAAKLEAPPFGTSDLYLGLGELLCEQGDLDGAAQQVLLARKAGEQSASPGWPHRLGLTQARLKEAQGDEEGALALLAEAERTYVRNPMPDQPIAAMKARVWIRQARLDEALAWAGEQGLSPDDDLDYGREFEHLTLARALIALGRSDRAGGALRDAQGLLRRLLSAAEAGGRTGGVIESLMLQAMAHQAKGARTIALAALERALGLAQPEGYVQLFRAEGESMRSLLADCRSRMQNRKRGENPELMGYVEKLLAAFAPPAAKRTPEAAPPAPGRSGGAGRPTEILEPLSRREREVLKMLGTELSGPEIAQALSVSLNTVRTHTKSIYGKLGANSRREAVRRAGELGLL